MVQIFRVGFSTVLLVCDGVSPTLRRSTTARGNNDWGEDGKDFDSFVTVQNNTY